MDGAETGDTTPSYLVVMRGNFSGPAPTYPGEPSSAVPTTDKWSVETLVVDAATGQVTDSGGGNTTPNLSSVGATTTVSAG